jgi:hypothetical protein
MMRSRALALTLLSCACNGELTFGGLFDRSDLLPDTSLSTTDVQMVDVDGDGRLDLVWANQDWPTMGEPEHLGKLEVTVNRGGDGFEVLGDYTDLGPWQFIQPFDADGDEDVDLLLSKAARSEDELLLLLNDGRGMFARGEGLPSITGDVDGIIFGRVTTTDLDLDGDLDVLMPTFISGDFTVGRPDVILINDGTGTFVRGPADLLPALAADDDYTLSIAAGDVTGDGAPDLYLGEAERRQRLLVNDGTGRFRDVSDDDGTGQPCLPLDELRAYRSSMIDVDGDQDLDIVVINDAAAMDGVVLATENLVYENDGTGHFTLGWMANDIEARDSRGLAWGDINDDDVLDIVLGNGTATYSHEGHSIQVLLGEGEGDFMLMGGVAGFGGGVFGVAVGDLDGDARADIAAAVAEPAPDDSLRDILLLSSH